MNVSRIQVSDKTKSSLAVKNSINFSGWRRFPSGVFSDEDVQLARKYLRRHDVWQDELLEQKKEVIKRCTQAGIEAENEDEPLLSKAMRLTSPTISIIADRARYHIRVAKDTIIAEEYIQRLSGLVDDLRAGHKGKPET